MFGDELTMINRVFGKVRLIIIPTQLQPKAVEQLHINHMGTENTRLPT